MKRLALILLTLIITPAALRAQGNHEYSPLQEKTVNYKSWTLNDLVSNKPVSLRSLLQGKKMEMVLYFETWCPNWRNEATEYASLYDNYKEQEIEIVSIRENCARAVTCKFLGTP